MWAEGVIRQHARDRYGLVARPWLVQIGVSDHEIARRLNSGRLQEMHPGVYYLDAAPATWKTVLLAGVLAAGKDAAASHRSAATLWELDGVYSRVIEVTVPFTDEPEPDGVLLHRTRRALDAVRHERIPVTSVERTLLDLASLLPTRVLEKLAASALRRNLATVESIGGCIVQSGGRGVTGTRKMRHVLNLVDGDQSGSISEIDVAQLIRRAPIAPPVQQLKVLLPGGANAYPDFAWPDRMKIVEIDGFGAHSTPEQLQHDLERQNGLLDLGYEIRRFTAREVRQNPAKVLDEIVRFVGSDRSVRVYRA